MSCADLGKATIVGVWAKAETTCGTFVMPAATDVILPTGYPAVNQEFPTTDGMEISNSLDITEEFQSSAQPVSFTIPMYTRVPIAASLGTAIQGDVLFQSLLGSAVAATTVSGAVQTEWSAAGTSLAFDTLAGGWFPDMGVILAGTEQIFYRGITWTSAVAGTFLNCERGYIGTTAAIHADDSAFSLTSRFFRQDNDSPPFSTVVQLDHTTFYITGCAANSATLGITNEGGMGWSFDCQALSFEWAGKCTLVAASAASGQADVVVPDAKLFSVGAYIQNTTLGKDNTSGYEITAINYDTNTLTLGDNLDANWVATNVVEGFQPASTSLAYTIENRYTDVYVDDTATTVQNTDLSISCPKQFITDEVGSTYPTAFVEDKRAITGTFALYARAADAKYIYDNTQRTEVKMHVLFGETEGQRMGISMRRTKLTNPTISGNGPTMNMSLNLKALGKIDSTTSEVGENSLELVTM